MVLSKSSMSNYNYDSSQSRKSFYFMDNGQIARSSIDSRIRSNFLYIFYVKTTMEYTVNLNTRNISMMTTITTTSTTYKIFKFYTCILNDSSFSRIHIFSALSLLIGKRIIASQLSYFPRFSSTIPHSAKYVICFFAIFSNLIRLYAHKCTLCTRYLNLNKSYKCFSFFFVFACLLTFLI